LVGAIETRSLPSSLAAARRGFTFYLADSSGSVDLNRLGGPGEPPLPFVLGNVGGTLLFRYRGIKRGAHIAVAASVATIF
jgi:hypothetical protein